MLNARAIIAQDRARIETLSRARAQREGPTPPERGPSSAGPVMPRPAGAASGVVQMNGKNGKKPLGFGSSAPRFSPMVLTPGGLAMHILNGGPPASREPGRRGELSAEAEDIAAGPQPEPVAGGPMGVPENGHLPGPIAAGEVHAEIGVEPAPAALPGVAGPMARGGRLGGDQASAIMSYLSVPELAAMRTINKATRDAADETPVGPATKDAPSVTMGELTQHLKGYEAAGFHGASTEDSAGLYSGVKTGLPSNFAGSKLGPGFYLTDGSEKPERDAAVYYAKQRLDIRKERNQEPGEAAIHRVLIRNRDALSERGYADESWLQPERVGSSSSSSAPPATDPAGLLAPDAGADILTSTMPEVIDEGRPPKEMRIASYMLSPTAREGILPQYREGYDDNPGLQAALEAKRASFGLEVFPPAVAAQEAIPAGQPLSDSQRKNISIRNKKVADQRAYHWPRYLDALRTRLDEKKGRAASSNFNVGSGAGAGPSLSLTASTEATGSGSSGSLPIASAEDEGLQQALLASLRENGPPQLEQDEEESKSGPSALPSSSGRGTDRDEVLLQQGIEASLLDEEEEEGQSERAQAVGGQGPSRDENEEGWGPLD
jgi:hypothetical protein